MKSKEIIITSTGLLQGYIIDEYVSTIDATATIGTGFITQIFSDWTDTFGVKSGMIEKKLHIIKEEVKRKLIDKAIKLKCNAILGLSIDIDEISSNQKMIFMVTASGTAVKCKKENFTNEKVLLSGDYLKKKRFLSQEYINKIEEVTNASTPSFTAFKDLANDILDKEFFEFIEKSFLECIINMALILPKTDVLEEEIIEILDNMQHDILNIAFLDMMFEMSNDQSKILNFRNTESYKSLCEYFTMSIPFEVMYQYLQKENDYFNVIIMYPLLLGFKNSYGEQDKVMLLNIITSMKSQFWNEQITEAEMIESNRVCVCGEIIQNNCSCGKDRSINMTTYKLKKQIIDQLEFIIKEFEVVA